MLFNSIYSGEGPSVERRGSTVVPIFEKGDHLDPNNYRGIALVSTLLNVITNVLADRLQTAYSVFKILRREQVDFIQGREGVSQADYLLEC